MPSKWRGQASQASWEKQYQGEPLMGQLIWIQWSVVAVHWALKTFLEVATAVPHFWSFYDDDDVGEEEPEIGNQTCVSFCGILGWTLTWIFPVQEILVVYSVSLTAWSW